MDGREAAAMELVRQYQVNRLHYYLYVWQSLTPDCNQVRSVVFKSV